MAEALVSVAKLLSTKFQMAYGRDTLPDESIQTIQSVLIDAEKKQETSAAVKVWIKRLKDVLYDAEDLFDEVALDSLLRQDTRVDHSRLYRKVRATLTRNTAASSFAKRARSIRKRLIEISADMTQFGFVKSAEEKPANMGRRADLGSFVDPNDVIGREDDKKAILEMLFDDSIDADPVPVIAIVGIGGIGKSTLSHLVYNDKQVQMNFDQVWFACISNAVDEKQVLGKIFQSIKGENFKGFSVSHLNSKIRDSVKDIKFLLVLEDMWDDHRARWQNRRSLFSGGAKGSRIICTTRSMSVARAAGALPYELLGLSDDASWKLFQGLAFTPEQEKDPKWISLGREIVNKCANVPLAIRIVASLLYTKDTFQEWESVKDEEQKEPYGDSVLHTLKLSYDHLSSSMKQCFSYCSLFPKGSDFDIKKLVYLWIAQGYVNPSDGEETIEHIGYSYFMYLLTRGLFHEAKEDEYGEVVSCKMHDLVHDVAIHVAGDDTILLDFPFSRLQNDAGHVSVDCEMANPGEIIQSLDYNNRLRSLLLVNGGSRDLALDHMFTNLKSLRALSLSNLGIENVPSGIVELKHLRYLDLSQNSFFSLPDSMMNLVNLLTLDIEGCYNLKQLPNDFRKLINLRCLNNRGCYELKHMPPGIGELACLQYLSSFRVGKPTQGVQWSKLDALDRLTQLTGELLIDFETGIENWDEDESWQLPVSLQRLHIWEYPGRRIPHWASERANNLAYLHLGSCLEVRHLPPLRSLPHLRVLSLRGLLELEYIEDDEIEVRDSWVTKAESSTALFFPQLEQLELRDLPNLKGWSMRFAAHQEDHSLLSFGLLSKLTIINSPELKSIPLSRCVRKLELYSIDSELVQQLLSPSSLQDLSITDCQGPLDFPREALASLRKLLGLHSNPHLGLI